MTCICCLFSEPVAYLSAKKRHMNTCYTLEVMSITTTEVRYGLLFISYIFFCQCVCDHSLCNRATIQQVSLSAQIIVSLFPSLNAKLSPFPGLCFDQGLHLSSNPPPICYIAGESDTDFVDSGQTSHWRWETTVFTKLLKEKWNNQSELEAFKHFFVTISYLNSNHLKLMIDC